MLDYFDTDAIRYAIATQEITDSIVDQVVAFMWEYDTYGFMDAFSEDGEIEEESAREEALFLLQEESGVLLDRLSDYEEG